MKLNSDFTMEWASLFYSNALLICYNKYIKFQMQVIPLNTASNLFVNQTLCSCFLGWPKLAQHVTDFIFRFFFISSDFKHCLAHKAKAFLIVLFLIVEQNVWCWKVFWWIEIKQLVLNKYWIFCYKWGVYQMNDT